MDFFGRQQEMAQLSELATEAGAQFLILYGRRRVGKTTLLRQWVEQSGLSSIYWVASRLSPTLQLRSFSQILYNAAHPDAPCDDEFAYHSWEMALRQAAEMAANRRLVLILDEFPYVAEAETGLASVIQNVWDHHFQNSQIFLVLAGSHVGMMMRLLHYQAPLYGRFTGHLHLKPLPFSSVADFLPRYSPAQRVACYAILGGIPAYLERFDDKVNLANNVKRRILSTTGIFRVDPLFLLQDQVREPRNFLSLLYTIGAGHHTVAEIVRLSGLPKQHVSTYLSRLADLHMVERRIPVTVPPKSRSRRGRWHLLDPYLRFYFRFIEPNSRALELGLMDTVWSDIRARLRAFIGVTTFEELCRQWVVLQAQRGQLPFAPEDVGSHWAREVQVDVVAISWRDRELLLAEAKWTAESVGRGWIKELVEDKTHKVLATMPNDGDDWIVHYAFFSRSGFTLAAQNWAAAHDVRLVQLDELDTDLTDARA